MCVHLRRAVSRKSDDQPVCPRSVWGVSRVRRKGAPVNHPTMIDFDTASTTQPTAASDNAGSATELSTATIVERSVVIGVLASLVAAVVGTVAGALAWAAFAADGDPGGWDGLETAVAAIVTFFVIGLLSYVVGVAVAIKRRIPSGRRLLATLITFTPIFALMFVWLPLWTLPY